jgi:hypothetical protein
VFPPAAAPSAISSKRAIKARRRTAEAFPARRLGIPAMSYRAPQSL